MSEHTDQFIRKVGGDSAPGRGGGKTSAVTTYILRFSNIFSG